SPTSLRPRLDRGSKSGASTMTGKSIPHVVLVAVCAATVWSTALPAQPPQSDTAGIEFFEKKIRPVLVERCYECHSATATKLKGGLRLDSREGLRKGGDSGPVIAPGEPDNSLLIKAIRYTDPELKMPPKRRLSAEVVADFEAWVKRGAPDPRTATANDLADGKQWA